MRVALIGAAGVVGHSALDALHDAGHDTVQCAAASRDGLRAAVTGADAVVDLSGALGTDRGGLLPGAWRREDRLRATASAQVVAAARECGVRRLVQAGASSVYADQGDAWITEASPLAITAMTEPTAVAESLVQDFTCGSRVGVVLRLGAVLGDDPQAGRMLHAAALHRGTAEGWAHVVHATDVGRAAAAALHAPSGVFNVGTAPVARRDLLDAYADDTPVEPLSKGARWLLGARLEPLARSLRVCSDHFTAQTGWLALHERFEPSWLLPRVPSDAGV